MDKVPSVTPLFTTAGVCIPQEQATVSLRKQLHCTTVFGDEYNLFWEADDHFFIPRNCCVELGKDLRDEGLPIECEFKFIPRHTEQAEVLSKSLTLLNQDVSHIMCCPTGYGKCTGANTPILMADGAVKMVQDVVVGDQLMGPDSTPRNVLSTTKGTGPLYQVTPTKGDHWVCNDVHVLSLKRTNDGTSKAGTVDNIELCAYLKKNKTYKHTHKLWRTGVEFPPQAAPEFDPYVVGLYLSDGIKSRSGLTLGPIKKEALDYVASVCEVGRIYDTGNNCLEVSLLKFNTIRKSLLTPHKERHIPNQWLLADRSNRLLLLAGILDGDGCLNGECNFDFICKDECYADQVLFLCRSLGLAAYKQQCTKGIKSIEFEGTYYRITISGDTHLIPTKVGSKQASPRKQKKDVLVTGFGVDALGDGDYYGFELDGDHLFLLGDFTVTHNTYLGSAVAACLQVRTLVVTTKEDIIWQWKDAIQNVLGIDESEIGIWRGKSLPKKHHKVVISLVQSICKGPDRYPDCYDGFGLAIFDECFHPSHELLTDKGWKCVAEVKPNDLVAQVDATTGLASFVRPEKVITKDFSGDLVALDNQRCSLLATPNHQHLLYRQDGSAHKVTYENVKPLGCWSQRYSASAEGSCVRTLSAKDRLKIAYQADGTYLRKRHLDGTHSIRFSFRKGRKVDALVELLALLPYQFSKKKNARGDTNICVWVDFLPEKTLDWLLPLDGGIGFFKDVLEEVVRWDGQQRADGGGSYWSTRSECVDLVQSIASLANLVSTKSRIDRKAPHSPLFRVNWYGGAVRSIRSLKKTYVSYTGPVFCVRVPTGNVITRRKGKVSVTGNCHRMSAQQFSQTLKHLPSKLRLGLSATPHRKDRKDLLFRAHVGEVLVTATQETLIPKVLLKRTGWKVPTRKTKEGFKKIPHSPGKTMHLNKMLASDFNRNAIIVNFLLSAKSKGRITLVFCDTTRELDAIEQALLMAGTNKGDIGWYIGLQGKVYSGNQAQRKKQRELGTTKPIILTTYKMTSEATDLPWVDTCVLASPRSDVLQTIGRIRREYPGKKQPVVLDLVDDDSFVYKAYHKKRIKWYSSLGAKMVAM